MENSELQETLERLHLELLQLKTDDDTERERAEDLAEDIRARLETLETEDDHAAAQDLLQNSAAAFDASHPHLSKMMRSLSDMLSSIGI